MRVFYPALTGAIAALVLMASGIWSPIHGAEAMSELRQGVEVEDDVIRLGDLFSNTGDRASIIVRSAPGPGNVLFFPLGSCCWFPGRTTFNGFRPS